MNTELQIHNHLERMMEKIRRERRSADAWREIVTRQEQSGLSVHAFCAQEDVEPASLYAWRSRIGRLDAG